VTGRRVTLRIGLPEARGPRHFPSLRAGGVRVEVTEPMTGPSGTRAVVSPCEPETGYGERWEVEWSAPDGRAGAEYFRVLKDARARAKHLRENGPG
jgi:hypothetical protein